MQRGAIIFNATDTRHLLITQLHRIDCRNRGARKNISYDLVASKAVSPEKKEETCSKVKIQHVAGA